MFNQQASGAPPPPPATMPPPPELAVAPTAAAAAAGSRKVTITPAMSKALSPKSLVPDEVGTERRGVDPMKLRADNEKVEEGEKLMQQMKSRYGEPEQ